MKILFLSDIPPCENLTGGLVLAAMVRLLPRDSICAYIVANPTIDIQLSPEFANIPMVMDVKANESWSWLPQGRFTRKLSSAVSLAGEKVNETFIVPKLVQSAIAFGREQGVDRVWAVLQGQTTIRMAQAVARGLGVPLHTQVWDPFSWWAQANRLDGITTRRIQRQFDKAINASTAVATASEAMSEYYRQELGATAGAVIASHSASLCRHPKITRNADGPILIGMAGQFYAAAEWLKLLDALNAAGWVVAGRPVRIVVMGPQKPPGVWGDKVSFLGWKSQTDAARILSTCDMLYCPYPFDPGMRQVSQYSFPSKLVLYLAAGRPIIFHGPDYSSPAHYVQTRDCGVLALGLQSSAVYNEIERLAVDQELTERLAGNATRAFLDDFTLESMRRNFSAFIGGELPPVAENAGAHRADNGDAPVVQRRERYHGSLALTVFRALRVLVRYYRRIASLPRRGVSFAIRVLGCLRRRVFGRSAVTPCCTSNVACAAGTPSSTPNYQADENVLWLTSASLDRDHPVRDTASMPGRIVQRSRVVIAPGTDGAEAADASAEAASASILRLILENGVQRLLVTERDSRLIAMAVKLADLVSLKLSVPDAGQTRLFVVECVTDSPALRLEGVDAE